MEKQVPVDIVQFHACTGMRGGGGGGGGDLTFESLIHLERGNQYRLQNWGNIYIYMLLKFFLVTI